MKKFILLVVLFVFTIQISAFAFTFDLCDYDFLNESLPLQKIGRQYLMNVESKQYIYDSNSGTMIGYNDRLASFIEQKGSCQCIWTGTYYYVRPSGMDPADSTYEWLKWAEHNNDFTSIELYDENFKLIKTKGFDICVKDISFYNGIFYCYLPGYRTMNGTLIPERFMSSVDFETWNEVDGPLPRTNGDFGYKSEKNINFVGINSMKNSVSFNRDSFLPITYEDSNNKLFQTQFGQWIIKVSQDKRILLSNDNVYEVAVGLPEELILEKINFIYMDNGTFNIVCKAKGANYKKLTLSIQEIYDELERLKSAPYACVNNTILGFEQPPVTESDRTLVPMRFLFEQLGADVTWDEATETATAKKANTTINFSIDNTTATVNGAEAVMDVPARLVGDKMMVPLRFLSEEMGYTVEWDEETRMATITTPMVSRMAEAEDTDVFGEWIR